jgi:hypothetical protein
MGLKNLGPKLTNIFKGTVNSIPEEFQSDMTVTDQAVPNDVMPDETDVDLVASQVTTNQRNERRRKNTYLTLPAERDDRQLDGPQHSGSTFSAVTKTIKTIAAVPQTLGVDAQALQSLCPTGVKDIRVRRLLLSLEAVDREWQALHRLQEVWGLAP